MEFQFDSFIDFLQMGGYALYVWAVYGLFAVFVAFNVISPLLAKRRILRQLKGRIDRSERGR